MHKLEQNQGARTFLYLFVYRQKMYKPRADMTLPRVTRDLLMLAPSFNLHLLLARDALSLEHK